MVTMPGHDGQSDTSSALRARYKMFPKAVDSFDRIKLPQKTASGGADLTRDDSESVKKVLDLMA